MKHIKLISIIAALGLGLASCAALPKNVVQTETIIPASPDEVWSVLVDTQSYASWNPFIIDMQGAVVEGQRLTNTMEPTPGDQRVFKPKILMVRPSEELRWLGRAGVPGIFDGEHYFLLEPAGEGTRLVHGESFSGLALLFIDTNQFEANFLEMNAALSERVATLQSQ